MKFICVEGNIGSGKTSLAKTLSKKLNAEFVGEEFEDNPFLPLFYNEPQKFSFALEFSFLLDRARQLKNIVSSPAKLHVADYYIEKCLWFAENNLTSAQFAEFAQSYPSVAQITPRPDLIVFLHLDTQLILENIKKRGRNMEKEIAPEYIRKLNEIYLSKAGSSAKSHSVLNFMLSSNTEQAYNKVLEEIISIVKKPPASNGMSLVIPIDA